ncbi:hypothetical protein DFH09DRAFT_1496672 [Mycena vulgaris]|nr:hypothetical protein DFH09DRAFT_1496672 [Mycena vulgaris]
MYRVGRVDKPEMSRCGAPFSTTGTQKSQGCVGVDARLQYVLTGKTHHTRHWNYGCHWSKTLDDTYDQLPRPILLSGCPQTNESTAQHPQADHSSGSILPLIRAHPRYSIQRPTSFEGRDEVESGGELTDRPFIQISYIQFFRHLSMSSADASTTFSASTSSDDLTSSSSPTFTNTRSIITSTAPISSAPADPSTGIASSPPTTTAPLTSVSPTTTAATPPATATAPPLTTDSPTTSATPNPPATPTTTQLASDSPTSSAAPNPPTTTTTTPLASDSPATSATPNPPATSTPATVSPASTTSVDVDTTSGSVSSGSPDAPSTIMSTVTESSPSISLSSTSTSQDASESLSPISISTSSTPSKSSAVGSSDVSSLPSPASESSSNASLIPAASLPAPTGVSTPDSSPEPELPTTDSSPSPPQTDPALFPSTTFLQNIITGVTSPLPSGSLFTTTMTYTSGGATYTTTSTGVVGTGSPPARDFAHNAGAIVGVALACVVAVILGVVGAFFACRRFKPRARQGVTVRGGLRRPAGSWRSPLAAESVHDLAEGAGTALLHGRRSEDDNDMVEVRAGGHGPKSTLSRGDMIPSSVFISGLIDPFSDSDSTPLVDSAPPRFLDPNSTRSSLLNPPASTSTSLPPPITPSLDWRPSSGQLLPPPAAPDADDPPTPTGLLRPSLTALQWHSSRSFGDDVDHSRLIGARRIESGGTVDTIRTESSGAGL